MSDTKTRAAEIYQQHIGLATTDPRNFRKTVMDQIMSELNVSLASAATHYNNAKKASPVEGLGRATVTKGARKITTSKGKSQEVIPDEECYTVLEIIEGKVGRTFSYEFQGEASEVFEKKVYGWPNSAWVMIKGLGQNPGDPYYLNADEKEIRFHSPVIENV